MVRDGGMGSATELGKKNILLVKGATTRGNRELDVEAQTYQSGWAFDESTPIKIALSAWS